MSPNPSRTTPIPGVTFTRTTPEPAPGKVRVMSFNVRQANLTARSANHPDPTAFQWFPSRAPAAVTYVKSVDPDIIGFQEVGHRVKGLNGQRIPGDMITPLVEGLSSYTFTEVPEENNYLPIAFRTDRFSLIDDGRIQIQFTSDQYSDSNRFATWAMLRDKQTQNRLLVMNVWANDGKGRAMALGRAQAWERLLPVARRLSSDYTIPTVLAGDFNAHAEAMTYPYNAHLTAFPQAGWLDASQAPENLQKVEGASSYNSWGRTINGTKYPNAIRLGDRIDYIWTTGGAVPRTWQIYLPRLKYRTIDGTKVPFAVGIIPSDHWPVISDVDLP